MTVIDDLKRHEGFRSKPYRCTAGRLTIGYGINLDAGITEIEARMLLVHRVGKIRAELHERLHFFSTLSERRQDVLINMAFNLGIDGLMQFKNTLRHIERGEYEQAASAMLKSKWARQVGNRAIELAEMMRNG